MAVDDPPVALEEAPEPKPRWKLPGATSLRYRDFRLYFIGYFTEVSGQQMLWVAQGWLIYELSGSAFFLGLAGLARAIPSTVLSLVGGALADKLDQRKLLIGVQALQMALLVLVATVTATGNVEVWHLIVILSASAAVQSFENPARQAIFPRLIPRSALMDAVALNSTIHPGTRFFGPVLGGLIMWQAGDLTGSELTGAAILFYLTACGYVINAFFIYLIHLPKVEAEGPHTSVLADIAAGMRFVLQNPIFTVLIGMTYCVQFFSWSFQSLFPVFNKDIFDGNQFQLGLLYSTLGLGSLLGSMTASNLTGVQKRGWIIIGGFTAQACLLLLFAGAPSYWFAISVLLFLGLSQAIFNVTSQATLQYLVPNDFRGRVMGIWGMTYTAVQPLGQLQMGSMAGAFGPAVAVFVGSIAMLTFCVLILLPNGRLRNLSITFGSEASAQDQRRVLAARH